MEKKPELRVEFTHSCSAKATKQENQICQALGPSLSVALQRPRPYPSKDNLVPVWAAGGTEKPLGLGVCVCVCVAGGEAKGGQKALTLFSFPPFSSFVQSTSPSLQSLLWREGARKPCSVPRVKGWACRGFAAPRLLLGKRGPGASDESATV